MRDEAQHGDGAEHSGEAEPSAGDSEAGNRRRRRRSQGRYRLAGRFGPAGGRKSTARELYATQTARTGDGLYTLEAWQLAPRITRSERFALENPHYLDGAPCWALALSSPDRALRAALYLRWLGRPFLPLPGPHLVPPQLVLGNAGSTPAWSNILEAELGLHSLAEAMRAQGTGVLVY